MSTSKRRTQPGVIHRLAQEPQRFEFFQAVRLLQRWLPAAPRGSLVPTQLRFRNSISLSFPVGEIESLKWIATPSLATGVVALPLGMGEPSYLADSSQCGEGNPAASDAPDEPASEEVLTSSMVDVIELVPSVMGLLGATGALPTAYTDLIAQRELYQRDHAARAFLDLFSHRLAALFYGAWKKGRLHLHYEEDRRKTYVPTILALSGMGQRSLLERLEPDKGGVRDESLAYFAATLQRRVLSARQLKQVLSSYLQVPVRVEQFAGRWYSVPANAQTALGLSNGILGQNALMGQRVWQRDLRVKLFLGPLDPVHFRRFLPGGPGALALKRMLSLLCATSLEFEVNLELQAQAVQGTRLASSRASTSGRLGWDTYLLTRPSPRPRCDVRYDADQTLVA